MAVRQPQTLTCPSCGKRDDMVWVEGIGPLTKPGEGPSYVRILDAGPWQVQTTGSGPFWQGSLSCPDCGIPVLTRPAA